MAPDDPVEAYQNSLTKLKYAEDDAKRVVQTVEDIAQKLRGHSWRTVMLANLHDVRFPADFDPARPSIDCNSWPTPEQIRDAIQAYHDARLASKNAWGHVPTDRRQGLRPPP